jgi:hypothetical protein
VYLGFGGKVATLAACEASNFLALLSSFAARALSEIPSVDGFLEFDGATVGLENFAPSVC